MFTVPGKSTKKGVQIRRNIFYCGISVESRIFQRYFEVQDKNDSKDFRASKDAVWSKTQAE